MKIMDQCLPCVVNQALKAAEAAGIQNKTELLQKVFTFMGQCNFDEMNTPEVMGDIFQLIKDYTGNPDPYKAARKHYNEMFLPLLPEFREKIHAASDPFRMAIKYSILGNIIDFSPMHNTMLEEVYPCFQKAEGMTLSIDHSRQMKEDILHAGNILYLGDNCGEICLDKLMLEMIHEMNPDAQLIFGTRGRPVVNDSIAEDAYAVGIQKIAQIIDNGDGSLGTVMPRVSESFKRVFEAADVVIAKGQGNYESLSEEKKNVYFLLMAKCPAIANAVGTRERALICKKSTAAD